MGRVKITSCYLWLFCSLVLMLGACDSESENCLDTRAINLDVSADLACEDCCVYPEVQLRLLPLRFNGDSLVFAQAGAASIVNNDTFRMESFGFYLHDLALVTSTGNRLLLSDTLSTRQNDAMPLALNEESVLRITPFSTSSYAIGVLLERDTFVSLSAKLGLPETLRQNDPSSQYRTSPLAVFDSLLISDSGEYLDTRIIYSDNTDTRVDLPVAAGLEEELVIDFPVAVEYEPSFNFSIDLNLMVDPFTQLDTSDLRNSLVRALNLTFEVRNLSLNR